MCPNTQWQTSVTASLRLCMFASGLSSFLRNSEIQPEPSRPSLVGTLVRYTSRLSLCIELQTVKINISSSHTCGFQEKYGSQNRAGPDRQFRPVSQLPTSQNEIKEYSEPQQRICIPRVDAKLGRLIHSCTVSRKITDGQAFALESHASRLQEPACTKGNTIRCVHQDPSSTDHQAIQEPTKHNDEQSSAVKDKL